MKKKIVSTMLCAAMITTMLAGCGGSDNGGTADAPAADDSATEAPAADDSATEAPAADDSAAAPAAGGGSVYWLNFKPESDEVLQDVAATYTEKTGVEVKVVTAASGTYSTTLLSEMDKSAPPTLFILSSRKFVVLHYSALWGIVGGHCTLKAL